MKTETIIMCVVALILGMLMANMLKSVCRCNTVVEGLPLSLPSLPFQIQLMENDIENTVSDAYTHTLGESDRNKLIAQGKVMCTSNRSTMQYHCDKGQTCVQSDAGTWSCTKTEPMDEWILK